MKIKEGLALTEFADGFLVVPQGGNLTSNVIISLNKTSAFIWKCLESEKTFDEILEQILNTFDVDRQKAKKDLENVLEMFRQNNLI